MTVENGVDPSLSQLFDNFVQSIEISCIVVSLRRFNSWPCYVEPDNGEAVLHKHGNVLTVEGELSIERAIAWIVRKALVYLYQTTSWSIHKRYYVCRLCYSILCHTEDCMCEENGWWTAGLLLYKTYDIDSVKYPGSTWNLRCKGIIKFNGLSTPESIILILLYQLHPRSVSK